MTIREYLEKYCEYRGMFEDQAKEVVNLFIYKDGSENPMTGRWDDSVEKYPPQILVVFRVTLNMYVKEWIDKNKPGAWYRELFT